MKFFIIKIIHTIKTWFLSHKYKTSEKGIYIMYYIADKYILETKPDDYNENYEQFITISQQKLLNTNFYNHFAIDETEEIKHAIAAIFALIKLLIFCSQQEQEKLFNYIQNSEKCNVIRECVKKRIIF